jgi:hypothetical protein
VPKLDDFSPLSGVKKGRIRWSVTPDLSHLIEGAVVRA